jgi:hypothetical protein
MSIPPSQSSNVPTSDSSGNLCHGRARP